MHQTARKILTRGLNIETSSKPFELNTKNLSKRRPIRYFGQQCSIIEKLLEEDIGFRVISANNTPDFRTISDFRKDHLKALAALFLQVLKLWRKAGQVKLGHVSLDGTKIGTNASKHKAMSYQRMKEEEARLEVEVQDLLRKAEAVDEEENRTHGKNKRGDELPKELAFRESRLKKIRQARAALEDGQGKRAHR